VVHASGADRIANASRQRDGPGFGEESSLHTGRIPQQHSEYDIPLLQATTASLDALKAYSSGQKAVFERNSAEVLSSIRSR
jgi:hypothetical protein